MSHTIKNHLKKNYSDDGKMQNQRVRCIFNEKADDIFCYRVSLINACTSSVLISIKPDSSSESFLTR